LVVFGLRALRFNVAVWSFFGFNVRVLDSLMNAPARIPRLLGRAKRRSIRFTEHLTGDGPTVFEHVCRMGLEGIVSKRLDAPYRSGPSKVWLKSKNPGERGGAPGARGGVALAPHPGLFMVSPVIYSSSLPRSPSGQQDDGEHSHAEADGGDPGNFNVGNPS
jgi:hypothetical protein